MENPTQVAIDAIEHAIEYLEDRRNSHPFLSVKFSKKISDYTDLLGCLKGKELFINDAI